MHVIGSFCFSFLFFVIIIFAPTLCSLLLESDTFILFHGFVAFT